MKIGAPSTLARDTRRDKTRHIKARYSIQSRVENSFCSFFFGRSCVVWVWMCILEHFNVLPYIIDVDFFPSRSSRKCRLWEIVHEKQLHTHFVHLSGNFFSLVVIKCADFFSGTLLFSCLVLFQCVRARARTPLILKSLLNDGQTSNHICRCSCIRNESTRCIGLVLFHVFVVFSFNKSKITRILFVFRPFIWWRFSKETLRQLK